jgi:hypothetical protein
MEGDKFPPNNAHCKSHHTITGLKEPLTNLMERKSSTPSLFTASRPLGKFGLFHHLYVPDDPQASKASR